MAIVTHCAIGIGLALSGSFAELAVLSTLAVAPLYMGSCAAALVLRRRGVAHAGTPLDFRWLGLAAGIATAGMLVMIALASRAEILGAAAILATIMAIYWLQTRLRLK